MLQLGQMNTNGCAWGQFWDTLNQTGWGVFEMRTSKSCSDTVQMYAAGYLEGALTAERIYQSWINMGAAELLLVPEMDQFWKTQDLWAQEQAAANAANSSFWRQISLSFQQLNGMAAGYDSVRNQLSLPYLGSFELYILQVTADGPNIFRSLFLESRPDWLHLTLPELQKFQNRGSHCSVLVVLTSNYSDLFFGHDTWSSYGFMNRIYKMYYFDLNDPSVVGKGVSFSSYPGVLVSTDDYYLTTAGLAVTETTNEIYNSTELDLIIPQRLPFWLRVRAANALASTAPQWTSIASTLWSGTYANQWIVLDYKRFTPGKPLKSDALWIMEEIPSNALSEDVTAYLARGHWPSYNVPFIPTIYDLSGYPELVEVFGPDQSYDLAPRAKIFRRDVGNVTSLSTYQYLMRYNDYQTDPYSQDNPCYAVMCREDLETPEQDASAFGGIDTKCTCYSMFQTLMTQAFAGPTTQGQPPFQWTSEFTTPHLGQPEMFNFTWEVMQPSLFPL